MASSATTTTDPAYPAPPAAPAVEGAEADAEQLLTFVVDGARYGCRLAAVREIFVARAVTRLPGAPAHVLGLLNVRGALLTVLDVGRWLAGEGGGAGAGEGGSDGAGGVAAPADPAVPAAPDGHVLVIAATDGRAAGCRVDGLGRALPMPALEPSAASGNGSMGGVVLGIGEADGELVAVLDLPALVRQSMLFPGER